MKKTFIFTTVLLFPLFASFAAIVVANYSTDSNEHYDTRVVHRNVKRFFCEL